MCHTLFHIYGPIAIHSFGLMIAIAILTFTWLVQRDPVRARIIKSSQCTQIILLGIIAALIGGRMLYLLSNWSSVYTLHDVASIWIGGLSSLGALVAVLVVIPWYIMRHHIPALPLLDLFAFYAPILHALVRIGCLLAGCCYGKVTQLPWAIVYHDPESIAPLGICLHPTQLYSVVLLLIIFGILYYLRPHLKHAGQMTMLYLMLTNFERFLVDFYRGDQEFFAHPALAYFSIHQWVALTLVAIATLGFLAVTYYPYNRARSS